MDLTKYIIEALPKNEEYENLASLISETADRKLGDYALPCFSLSKIFHKSPDQIAEELKSKLNLTKYIKDVQVVHGYLNFFLNRVEILKDNIEKMNSEGFEFNKIGENKTLCIDYSSVNLAKYMHIGHLKNTITGESIARLAEMLGFKVIRINYIGDYGTPFGKIIVGYKLWGSKEDVDKRGIDALQDYYVKFNQEAENNEALNDEARATFNKIEQKDRDIYPIYCWIIDIAKKEAKRLLDLLDIHFDSWKGEASYAEELDSVVDFLNSKNLLEKSQGALVVNLDKYDMPPCLIRRSDGASLYATRDIAAAIDRYNTYHFDQIFYVTGHEQMLHFKQVFKVLELAGCDYIKNAEHIHYGLFSLPTGKISSRKGKQATLVDLMDYAHNKAVEAIEGREFKIEKPEDVAGKVARGALNFSALKVEVGKDCVFDIDKAFNFDGETAPYMQYSYTRIESILRRAQELNLKNIMPTFDALNTDEAFELFKLCNSVPNVIFSAYQKREPSMAVKRAMEICKTLNKFYTTTKVLEGSNDEIAGKIELLKLVKLSLQTLFHIICIDTLEEM